jgi:hypothetical protein
MARVIEWSQLAWGAHPCERGASESIGDTDTPDSGCFLNYNTLEDYSVKLNWGFQWISKVKILEQTQMN